MLYKDILCPKCQGRGKIIMRDIEWGGITSEPICPKCNGQGYIYQPVSCGTCRHTYYYDLDNAVCKRNKTTVKPDMACGDWEAKE